jgi:hypothetical protein
MTPSLPKIVVREWCTVVSLMRKRVAMSRFLSPSSMRAIISRSRVVRLAILAASGSRGLADYQQIGLAREEQTQPHAHDNVVVDEEDADRRYGHSVAPATGGGVPSAARCRAE